MGRRGHHYLGCCASGALALPASHMSSQLARARQPTLVRTAALTLLHPSPPLQTHMWYLQSTEEFKRKFPEIAEGKPKESVEAETEELRSWSVRLKSSAQE